MPRDPRSASRCPPAADRALTALLREASRAKGPPMDPQLPDRVLERLGLARPAEPPRTRARVARACPEGRGRRQALLVGLLALLALLALPAGAQRGARLAQAPGLGLPAAHEDAAPPSVPQRRDAGEPTR